MSFLSLALTSLKKEPSPSCDEKTENSEASGRLQGQCVCARVSVCMHVRVYTCVCAQVCVRVCKCVGEHFPSLTSGESSL